MKKMEKSLNQSTRKDVLNVVISISIMFLVGSCMMMIMVVESKDDLRSLKPKEEKNKNLSSDTLVVNNNQTRTGVNINR